MGLIVGSARSDENGRLKGGKAGDQTGREVSTQAYYMHSKGWYVLRPKNVDVASALAQAMSDLCENDNIGYCQTHRTGIITQLKRYKKLSKIATATETDCSEAVRACCMEIGFDPGDMTTANEADKLYATGQFEKKAKVTANTVLFNGDVLVTCTKGHTVIVISGNPRAKATVNSDATATKSTAAQSKDSSLAGTYTTTAGLNLRAGAGTSYKIVATMPKGSKVRNYGYYTAVGGVNWLYVAFTSPTGKEYTGFCSQKYLKK